MSEQQHTPGPWRYSETWRPPLGRSDQPLDANGNIFWGHSISGSNENGGSILPTLAHVHNFPDNIHANARLIAAAPDMLAALRKVQREFSSGRINKSLVTIVEAAIAKATGSKP